MEILSKSNYKKKAKAKISKELGSSFSLTSLKVNKKGDYITNLIQLKRLKSIENCNSTIDIILTLHPRKDKIRIKYNSQNDCPKVREIFNKRIVKYLEKTLFKEYHSNPLNKLGIYTIAELKKMTAIEKENLLNQRLSELETYDEFIFFLNDCETNYSKTLGYIGFFSKRTGKQASGFTHAYNPNNYFNGNEKLKIIEKVRNKNRVNYIYEDTKSNGSCRIKNMQRYLRIECV